MKKKTYNVSLYRNLRQSTIIEVEANNEEEAEHIAIEEALTSRGYWDTDYSDGINVEMIDETGEVEYED